MFRAPYRRFVEFVRWRSRSEGWHVPDIVDRGVVQYHRAVRRCDIFVCFMVFCGMLSVVYTHEAMRKGWKRQQDNKYIVVASPKLCRYGTTKSSF